MCTERDQTVDPILSACPTIVNPEYLQRHDQVASFIHWKLCKNFDLPQTEKSFEHTPQPATESTEVTILYSNNTINIDRKIEANRPEITIKNFEENTYIMIDVTVPADKNIYFKQFHKLSKYIELETELTKMWKL